MAVFVGDEQTAVAIDAARLAALARFVLADRRVPEAMEVALLFVDRAAITELNRHHMDQPGPTDVLAFPIDQPGETVAGEPALLGDVVICPEVAAGQAAEHRADATSELELLVVHGLLHLLGHDHGEDEERRRMLRLTDRLLADFRQAAVP